MTNWILLNYNSKVINVIYIFTIVYCPVYQHTSVYSISSLHLCYVIFTFVIIYLLHMWTVICSHFYINFVYLKKDFRKLSSYPFITIFQLFEFNLSLNFLNENIPNWIDSYFKLLKVQNWLVNINCIYNFEF